MFGGPAWTRETRPDGTKGQWYLHLFDSTQPDLNWSNQDVVDEFEDILRFWLARGVDGFRVDVAHGLIKEEGLPDHFPRDGSGSMGGDEFHATPYFGQDGVHEVWRQWRRVLDDHGPGHVLVAEAWVYPLTRMANWVRSDEMHQAFNFPYLETPWDARAQRAMISESLDAFNGVGAPATWVLSNHDVVRHASRLALTAENPQGHGIGPNSAGLPIPELGLKRARAATLMMLALPGSSYIYQGEELGLPEHVMIPDADRQDPTWFRTNHERYGRDGCRVPLPWTATGPAYGFNTTGETLASPARRLGRVRAGRSVGRPLVDARVVPLCARSARGTSTGARHDRVGRTRRGRARFRQQRGARHRQHLRGAGDHRWHGASGVGPRERHVAKGHHRMGQSRIR